MEVEVESNKLIYQGIDLIFLVENVWVSGESVLMHCADYEVSIYTEIQSRVCGNHLESSV